MSLWIATIFFTILLLYDNFPRFQFWFKVVFGFGWLMFASLLLIPLSLLRPGAVENAKAGARLMQPVSAVLGIKWTVSGCLEKLSKDEACVIVANHQSSVDILGMFHLWNIAGRMVAIAKQSLLYFGPFGITAYLCGTIFIERGNPGDSAEKLNSVGERLKIEKLKLWIFPEGTRNTSKSIALLPFKKGAFHVALQHSLPILPVVIQKHEFLEEEEWLLRPGSGRITVLPPLQSAGMTVEQLMEETRRQMMQHLCDEQ